MTTNQNSELPNVSFDLGTLEGGNDNQFVKFERERIQPDKKQHYRILPPFGEGANGTLFHRYSIHWGLTGERGQQKPVACSYPTEGFCPICKNVFDSDDELKRAEEAGDQTAVKSLTEYLKTSRARRFFVYNAVTTDGRVVILEIPKTAHDQLVKLIGECVYKENNAFDPTSLTDGAWFTFSKEGKGFSTKYTVKIKKVEVMVDGEALEKVDRSAMADDILTRIIDQLKAKSEDGPLYDIHALYDSRTARELQSFLDGGLIPDKKKDEPKKIVDTLNDPSTEDDIPDSVTDGPVNSESEVERLNKLQASGA